MLVLTTSPSLSPSNAQGNVDPVVLFGSQDAIKAAVEDCIAKAGPTGHVLNLGHGVLVREGPSPAEGAAAVVLALGAGRQRPGLAAGGAGAGWAAAGRVAQSRLAC